MTHPLARTAALLFAAAAFIVEGAHAAEDTNSPLTITRPGTVASAKGSVPNNFTGAVRVDMLQQAKEPSRVSAANVTFEPGARTVWHTHPLGQTLVVTAGMGLVQRHGGPIDTIRPGDVVWIPPHVKHWHGASPTTGMTHIALTETLGNKNVDWLEPVSHEQYAK